MILPRARFAFAAAILAIAAAVAVAFLQIIDLAISHTVVDAFSSIGFVIADMLGRHTFETTFSIATVVIQPLAVKTKDAWTMLGCSNAHGYVLIKKGEIDSYLEGRIRKVTVASIQAYIERKLAAAKKDTTPVRTEKATAASVAGRAERKAARGRPRLNKASTPIAAEEATPGT
jgi:hypothetical protein